MKELPKKMEWDMDCLDKLLGHIFPVIMKEYEQYEEQNESKFKSNDNMHTNGFHSISNF